MSRRLIGPLGIALVVLTAAPAHADPGDLDPSFGKNGIVITSVSDQDDHAFDVAVQADGKIVVVGSVGEAQGLFTDFGVVRFEADGALDQTFGHGGIVVTHLTDDYDSAHAVTIQPDGKIVVVGRWGADPNGVALVRYQPDGSLDRTFGDGGKVLSFFSPENSGAGAVVLRPGGGILVAGSIEHFAGFTPDRMLLAWYSPQGRLERFRIKRFKKDAAAAAVVFGPGRTVLVGGTPGFTAARFVGFHLDETFGAGGWVTTTVGPYSGAFDMAVQPDGRIVLAGRGHNHFTLVRYTVNGTLDSSFGDGGVVTSSIGHFSRATSIEVQADGKLLASGLGEFHGQFRVVLARYMPDGALDSSFGKGGVVTTAIGTTSFGNASALQLDGKLLVAGDTKDGESADYDFTVARYLTS